MEDLVFKNYQSDLQSKQNWLASLVHPYMQIPAVKNELLGIENLYEKVRTAKPEIMFYGIYNAGKSSVLNELLGRDEAKVDDIPTTDKINSYEWNGYKIVDTPGVDAPVEHERVTEAHLEQADVVLFVISAEGSHEYLENYRRLKSIADRGKKIIIVLNDKEGKLGGQDKGYNQLTEEQRQAAAELGEVKRKVAANCRAVGLGDSDYVIVEVNAKRAKNGRLKNQELLIERSNIRALENIIFSELKRMPTFDVLRRTVFEIEQHLDKIINILEQNEKDTSLQAVNGFLERLRSEKKAARQEVASYIERRAGRLGKELPGLIWVRRQEGQGAINQFVKKQQEAFLQDVQRQMQVVLHDLMENLNVAADDLAVQAEKLQISQSDGVVLPEVDSDTQDLSNTGIKQDDWKDNLYAAIDELQKMLKESGGVILSANGKESASGIAGAAAQGALLAPVAESLATTIGKSALGKALTGTFLAPLVTTIPPVVGPLVIGLSVLKALLGGGDDDIKQMKAKADAENERRRRIAEAEMQARQELQQRCQYVAEGLGDKIRVEVEIIINQIMDDVQRPFKEQAESSKGDVKKRMDDLSTLRQLYNEYEVIRYELGANS